MILPGCISCIKRAGSFDWMHIHYSTCCTGTDHITFRVGCRQGVCNRREIQLTRPTLPYYDTCFADGYSIWIRNICPMYRYRVYNNLFWIFLLQMEYLSLIHIWRGPPYHMNMHALQTLLHLYKKYLSDVQLLSIQ